MSNGRLRGSPNSGFDARLSDRARADHVHLYPKPLQTVYPSSGSGGVQDLRSPLPLWPPNDGAACTEFDSRMATGRP